MAAVKWIFVVIFGLGSAGSLAMAFVESGGPRTSVERKAPAVALRDFPQMTAVGTAPEAAKTPEPVAAKTPEPEPAKTPEPVAAKTPEPEPAKTPEPAAKPPEPKAEPVAAKPPEPKAAPVAAKPPEPEPKAEPKAEPAAKPPEPKPEPVAAKPPEPKPEPVAAPAPKPEGILNLRASDTADVFLDGKKLGGSPLLGIKAKVGNHKVRFDCYDAAGNTVAGPSQTITVKADQEVDVEFPCPSE